MVLEVERRPSVAPCGIPIPVAETDQAELLACAARFGRAGRCAALIFQQRSRCWQLLILVCVKQSISKLCGDMLKG